MSQINNSLHIPKFGGDIWYSNIGKGHDTDNDGKPPETPFATIGAGFTAMADGDALSIKAGTYTEENLNLSNDYAEMWCERGVLIDPAANTALTVSGTSCVIKGDLKVTPDTGAVGVIVSGDECRIDNVKVVHGTDCWQITGEGNLLTKCLGGFPTAGSASFNVTGAQTGLYNTGVVGNAATYGFKVTGSNTGILENCTSSGHTVSGYYLGTGTTNWTVLNCSTGGGDGKWRDIDNANIWSACTSEGILYPETKYKEITLNASTNYNLFKITGGVEILEIFGHVESALVGANTEVYFDLWSDSGGGGTSEPITAITGSDLGTAPVGTIMMKTEDPGKKVTVFDAGGPTVDKGADPKKKAVVLNADVDYDTYIRWDETAGDTDGGLHFHVSWRPITDTGFLAPA